LEALRQVTTQNWASCPITPDRFPEAVTARSEDRYFGTKSGSKY